MFACQVLCTGIQGISAVSMGGSLAKVGSSAKCCVLVFKAYMLHLLGVQRRFICQVLVSLVGGGSIGQRRFICQVLVSLVGGGPLAEEGSSAKSSLLWYWGGAIGRRFICQVISALIPGGHRQKKVHLLNVSSFPVLLLLHRRSFRITYERPNNLRKTMKPKSYNNITSTILKITAEVHA